MSEEWISARDAADAVWPGQKPAPVPNGITKCAEEGLVKAWAELLTKQGLGGKTRVPDGPIPTEFWGGRAMIPDWKSGVFTAHVQQNGSEEEWKAFGVRFGRAQIEEMAPPKTSENAASVPAPTFDKVRGGSPGKYDWAVAVGTIVFKWADQGHWHLQQPGKGVDYNIAVSQVAGIIKTTPGREKERAKEALQALLRDGHLILNELGVCLAVAP